METPSVLQMWSMRSVREDSTTGLNLNLAQREVKGSMIRVM